MLQAESSRGAQGSHLTKAAAAVDALALGHTLRTKRAYLPFGNASVWLHNASAASCYNPLMPWMERRVQRAVGLDTAQWNWEFAI